MAVLKVPRITTADRTSLLLMASEIVYDTDLDLFFGGDGVTLGGFQIGSTISDLGDLNDVDLSGLASGDIIQYNSVSGNWEAVAASSIGGVTSVNGQTGVVVLDADNIDDSTTTNKFATQAELDQIATNQTDIAQEVIDRGNADAILQGQITSNAADITALENRNINTDAPIQGGGDLSADRTISLDINSATAGILNGADEILFADVDDSNNVKKTTAQDIADLASGAVTSFNGRSGAVVSFSGDYDADQIDDATTTNKFATQAQLNQIGTNQTNISQEIIDRTNADAAIQSQVTLNNAKVSADGSIDTHNDVDLTGLADDDVLQYNLSTGNFEPVAASSIGGVNSWNGRTGSVLPLASDYNADQIDFDPSVINRLSATEVQAAIDEITNILFPTTGRFLYVDGTNGDDTNSGLNPGDAFETIQAAINAVTQNDQTISIFPNTYTEDLDFASKTNLTLESYIDSPIDSQVVEIQGQHTFVGALRIRMVGLQLDDNSASGGHVLDLTGCLGSCFFDNITFDINGTGGAINASTAASFYVYRDIGLEGELNFSTGSSAHFFVRSTGSGSVLLNGPSVTFVDCLAVPSIEHQSGSLTLTDCDAFLRDGSGRAIFSSAADLPANQVLMTDCNFYTAATNDYGIIQINNCNYLFNDVKRDVSQDILPANLAKRLTRGSNLVDLEMNSLPSITVDALDELALIDKSNNNEPSKATIQDVIDSAIVPGTVTAVKNYTCEDNQVTPGRLSWGNGLTSVDTGACFNQDGTITSIAVSTVASATNSNINIEIDGIVVGSINHNGTTSVNPVNIAVTAGQFLNLNRTTAGGGQQITASVDVSYDINTDQFQGPQGNDGNSTITSQAGAPSDPAPQQAFYLDNVSGDFYTSEATTSWGSAKGNLTGPQGPQGIPGTQGSNRIAKFTNILVGSVQPTATSTLNGINNVPIFDELGSDISVSSNTITINTAGTYKLVFNIFLQSTATRAAPGFGFSVNGSTPQTISCPTYIRNNSGHNNSSAFLDLSFQFSASDTIQIQVTQQGAAGVVQMPTGTSIFEIRKI